ncbi:hypothetical protein V6N12_014082 [Hibiscus sabdariffa]|uniref:Uncharacterized protein n=1 Tax=Hibiscus sabdariffa TaxID=183260 RepID=A0ABR2D0J0_9ROSI
MGPGIFLWPSSKPTRYSRTRARSSPANTELSSGSTMGTADLRRLVTFAITCSSTFEALCLCSYSGRVARSCDS